MQETKEPALWQALIPILFLIVLLSANVYIFGDASLDGSNQIVLILSAGVAAIVSSRLGVSWEGMLEGVVKSISSAMPSMLILLLIGALAGTWMLSGIVPAMIYYGLQILNPTIFLFAACMVSSIVSLATGSSWSTVATLGVALLGIGQALGIYEGLVAGAIISGAYFGDKMSPLSDTTNLAPAMAGTDLVTHIRYMTLTTVPSLGLTLLIYLCIGLFSSSDGAISDIEPALAAISGKFNITPWLFVVPAVVIFLIVRKVAAIPALLAGTLLGGVFALIFQPGIVAEVANVEGSFWKQGYVGVMKALYTNISVTTNYEKINDLLSTGGMAGMLKTIWLILCAMIFGGVMEGGGLLRRIAMAIISRINSTWSLITSTTATCIFFNITASDQYLSIVVPGRMYSEIYKKRNLKPENLSRTLEDSGTVTSVLVPWNTCGATQSTVLGVSTLIYAPYCFFNIISPLMTILFAVFNIKIRKIDKEKEVSA